MSMPHMMDAYGRCGRCGGEGALWQHVVMRRRWWLFGKRVPVFVYVCDECSSHYTRPAG